MKAEIESKNIKAIKSQLPDVEIKKHPPELLELDEETIAIARAKFAGVDFEAIYGDEDRSSPELYVRIQAKKIRELFETPEELMAAFSSEQHKTRAYQDMKIDGIDLEFVKNYCQKSQLDFVDDVEALIKVGFDQEKQGEANV